MKTLVRLSPEEKKARHKARCAAYYAANKTRHAEWQRKRRKEFPEERKRHDAAYRQRNAEKVRLSKERYRLANLDKVRAAKTKWRLNNPERMQAARVDWYRNNPDKKQVHRENRRARERNAPGKMSADILLDLLVLQCGKCAACRTDLSSRFELDHIMPLWLGGTNDDSNIQLLCRTCNRRKGRKHPSEFAQAASA